MSNVWQADGLGQNPLSSLQNQTSSVVHHCDYPFPGGLLWNPGEHGEVGIAKFAEAFTSRPIPKFRREPSYPKPDLPVLGIELFGRGDATRVK